MDRTGASGAAGSPHAGGLAPGNRAGAVSIGGANGSGFVAMGGTAGYGMSGSASGGGGVPAGRDNGAGVGATISSITPATVAAAGSASTSATSATAVGASGYRGPTACSAAGITYRQLDYWARTGLVEPTIRPASGSGSQRLYSFRDIIALKIVKRLLDTGVSLQNIRIAVGYLRARGDADLAGVTLMSDGASVYECTSPTEVFDLVQGGQGVFGIAVDAVCREVEGTLKQFPVERVGWATEGGDADPGPLPDAADGAVIDELARRRRIRAV